MRVGAIQSSYIPWRGYFDFISSVDTFVVYDDVQYSKGSWRNRNRLKMPAGPRWITVPVRAHLGQAVDEVEIGQAGAAWQDLHRRQIEASLGEAPYYRDALALWLDAAGTGERYLSRLNVRLIRAVNEYLGIRTPLAFSRELDLRGNRTERLLSMLQQLGATEYLSGPSASAYLDVDLLNRNGIRVRYKQYDYRPYPQRWGGFEGAVSVLDLVANTGPAARDYLPTLTPDTVVGEA
ncbi:MAG: WbqC family protein [bacterium]|jgi:hypothetical protein|nr:WbqC family protein [Betaproteobacteria bacterium]